MDIVLGISKEEKLLFVKTKSLINGSKTFWVFELPRCQKIDFTGLDPKDYLKQI